MDPNSKVRPVMWLQKSNKLGQLCKCRYYKISGKRGRLCRCRIV